MPAKTTFVDHDLDIAINLPLSDISELFSVPDFDPFQPASRATAGIDDIVAYLSARPLRHKPAIKTTIVLPADHITPDLQETVVAAIDRYCDDQEEQMRQARAANRYEGLAKLPIGTLAAIVTVIVGYGFLRMLPVTMRDISVVITPIITVIVWVAIWNPVEILLFDGWSDRRSLQIYKAIHAMQITIQSAGKL